MATSSISNNASSLHGRDDHAPLFALPRGSAFVSPKVGIRLRGYGVKIGAPPPSHFRGEAAFASRNGAPAPETWDPDGAASLVSSISAILCSLSAGAFSNQKRPAGAFGFQLEQLPERARGSIPRAELVIQG